VALNPVVAPFVVIDSSTALAALLPGELLANQAKGLLRELDAAGARLIAPVLWESETDSAIRIRVEFKKTLSLADETTFHTALDELDVERIYDPDNRERARQLAAQLGQLRVYDSTYLALADLNGALFWTADEKLFNAVFPALPFVRFVGNWQPSHSLK
jgi:predicted nucleic acid-binding protein